MIVAKVVSVVVFSSIGLFVESKLVLDIFYLSEGKFHENERLAGHFLEVVTS